MKSVAGRPCEGQRDLDPLKAGTMTLEGYNSEAPQLPWQGVEHGANKPAKPAATNSGWNWQSGMGQQPRFDSNVCHHVSIT